ncbi:MAG: polymerase III, delta subunit protein [Parcubacteria group bacterium GW2011_GWC2_45_7]|nr:MAG: polymerase III, delta subunit protein [Parcubacteria group bacterium GW2011_GWC2_45_7]
MKTPGARSKSYPSKLNLATISPADLQEETLRSRILAQPFLARKRLVILQNFFSEGRKKTLAEILLKTCKDIGENTILIIDENSSKPKTWKNSDARALWEYLEKEAMTEEFKPFYGLKLEAVIEKQAKQVGLEIERSACSLLALFCGSDLGATEQELTKLAAFKAGTGQSTSGPPRVLSEDVKKVCISSPERSIFEFLDAFGAKDMRQLSTRLEEQLSESDPLQLMSRIIGHLRALLLVSSKGSSGSQALRLHPFQLKKIQTQVRHWNKFELKKLLFGRFL